MKNAIEEPSREKWARFRFSVIAPLLAAPPPKGEVRAALRELVERTFRQPVTGEPVRFGFSTLERWYHKARQATDPVGELRHRRRSDRGEHRSLGLLLRQRIRSLYEEHPSWSYRLLHENLCALAQSEPQLGEVPSYAVVRRWMKSNGLFRKKRRRPRRPTAGSLLAEERLRTLEVRSFEVEYVGGLWHTDFHSGSLPVLTREGQWVYPQLLGVLDDCSRLGCHLQWYLRETAENLAHGLSQAFQKWGLPRALMSDRGGAETAAELEQGLLDLGVVHELTLPYSPYQNAKQEILWATIEGRLLAMLEGVEELTLELLNEATLAFVELEYNRKPHSELGRSPLETFLDGKSVLRDCPSSDELRRCFRRKAMRTQRRSDGTISVEGVRFEVPSRFRHLEKVPIRYTSWNLSSVDLVDEDQKLPLATLYPLNKIRNANAERRALEPVQTASEPARASGMAPLLKKLIADYAASGLPPAYLPKTEDES
jgi:transposase InsO family protein